MRAHCVVRYFVSNALRNPPFLPVFLLPYSSTSFLLLLHLFSLGNLEVLQWARANDCPWDVTTVDRAERRGHDHVVEWARANGCPTPAYIESDSSDAASGTDSEDTPKEESGDESEDESGDEDDSAASSEAASEAASGASEDDEC